MRVLVTGGAGYIGSHTLVELLAENHDIIVVDNLCNSQKESINRVREISGRDFPFYEVDLLDYDALNGMFKTHSIDAVIHFAGLKAVGESIVKPLEYYHNNITGTLSLCRAMRENGIKKIIFSSSATVYGDPHKLPITEDFPLSTTNPYGNTKLIIEGILKDLHVADPSWDVILLRYFNPVGAHSSGKIGEDPNGIPNNLVPYISQVAVGKLETLSVYGNDYPTSDGTGVRDYIHVVDLARGHKKALDRLKDNPGVAIYNLGTGRGYSVLEMVKAFESASKKTVAYTIVDRRPGDIAECYADASLAEKELNWTAEKGIDDMCEDAWRWQSGNPHGYRSTE